MGLMTTQNSILSQVIIDIFFGPFHDYFDQISLVTEKKCLIHIQGNLRLVCLLQLVSNRHSSPGFWRSNLLCRWLHLLPRELKDAAGPGCACCLFWPPADAAGRRPTERSHGLWQHVRRLSLVHHVTLAAKASPVFFIFSYSSSFFRLSSDHSGDPLVSTPVLTPCCWPCPWRCSWPCSWPCPWPWPWPCLTAAATVVQTKHRGGLCGSLSFLPYVGILIRKIWWGEVGWGGSTRPGLLHQTAGVSVRKKRCCCCQASQPEPPSNPDAASGFCLCNTDGFSFFQSKGTDFCSTVHVSPGRCQAQQESHHNGFSFLSLFLS